MNLPHKKPVLFAHEIVKKETKSAYVKCKFPYPPTLSMILEAAAQSSAALSEDENKEGFLVAASSVDLQRQIKEKELLIKVDLQMKMGNMNLFSFEIENTAQGKFTIYVK